MTDPETHMQQRALERVRWLQSIYSEKAKTGPNKRERENARLQWVALDEAIGEIKGLRATGDWRV